VPELIVDVAPPPSALPPGSSDLPATFVGHGTAAGDDAVKTPILYIWTVMTTQQVTTMVHGGGAS